MYRSAKFWVISTNVRLRISRQKGICRTFGARALIVASFPEKDIRTSALPIFAWYGRLPSSSIIASGRLAQNGRWRKLQWPDGNASPKDTLFIDLDHARSVSGAWAEDRSSVRPSGEYLRAGVNAQLAGRTKDQPAARRGFVLPRERDVGRAGEANYSPSASPPDRSQSGRRFAPFPDALRR